MTIIIKLWIWFFYMKNSYNLGVFLILDKKNPSLFLTNEHII
jgi:hypothetical protein